MDHWQFVGSEIDFSIFIVPFSFIVIVIANN